jgi:wobble nucleotide-excising tRNase
MSSSPIQKVNYLRDFGVYRSFENTGQTELPEFKKRNLIYGWNYSGKTTLSRLFQILEFPERPQPYSDGTFSVEQTDGTTLTNTQPTSQTPVRVFNRDYVTQNFQHEHTAPAVFIVGEDNVALRNRLESLRNAETVLSERIRSRVSEIDEEQGRIQTLATESARAFRELIGVTDFQRPRLETLISIVRNSAVPLLLSADQVQTKVETCRSTDQFTQINRLTEALPNFTAEVSNTEALLSRTASFDAIEGLAENPNLESWLRAGMPLHGNTNECQLCGNEIPVNRLDALRRHFSTASEQLLREVETQIQHLHQIQLNPIRIDQMRFIQEFRTDAQSAINNFNNALEVSEQLRSTLIEQLEAKRTSLERALQWEYEDTVRDLQARREAVNIFADQHNAQIQDLATVKQNARRELEGHVAADFIQRNNLTDRETNIQRLERKLTNTQKASSRIRATADRIASQIDRTAIGAERFTELVSFLLRDNEIRVESFQETEFRLMRGNAPADRLSDGEKTAITFAYFVTSLEADEQDLAQTIVYVDDPISSLDSNHVYAVFALIEERLAEAMQLFVSTHNSEFFNLLKAKWLKSGDRQYRRVSEAFYVRKVESDGISTAKLDPLPLLLWKHGSEYEFIFAQLKQFAENPTPSEYEAFCAPNLLRRFLEAYLGFRKPCTPAWHAKLDLIIDSDVKRREIHKLLDDASHLQRADRALQIPTFISSAHDATQAVLEGLESKDAEHFNSLVLAVSREHAN